jgi:ATP-dependent protease Clp ATPase subunit
MQAQDSRCPAVGKRLMSVPISETMAWALSLLMPGWVLFDLPSLEGVQEVVISKQVVEGTAPPLYVYADRSDHTRDASA